MNEGEGVKIKYGCMIFGGNLQLEYLDFCKHFTDAGVYILPWQAMVEES